MEQKRRQALQQVEVCKLLAANVSGLNEDGVIEPRFSSSIQLQM